MAQYVNIGIHHTRKNLSTGESSNSPSLTITSIEYFEGNPLMRLEEERLQVYAYVNITNGLDQGLR
ncbi:hypothetical protein N7495_006184 [Penicillium taxi]|uniref:uncharacterized protein n=1 Tax=Penicillium taxi TaxID=168475 RepID=UPI002544F7A7|nr:uncharacterized protein N7495_006184 [Penicillium taxi]KAJ5894493.1 hypothetical protein N7495_006184 [Penicillium taxi]